MKFSERNPLPDRCGRECLSLNRRRPRPEVVEGGEAGVAGRSVRRGARAEYQGLLRARRRRRRVPLQRVRISRGNPVHQRELPGPLQRGGQPPPGRPACAAAPPRHARPGPRRPRSLSARGPSPVSCMTKTGPVRQTAASPSAHPAALHSRPAQTVTHPSGVPPSQAQAGQLPRDGSSEPLRAPGLARLGRAQLNAARVALLGAMRRDGSPRISTIEPRIADGQLLVGCHGPVGGGLIAAEGQRKVEEHKPARAMEWLSRSPGKRRPARDGSFPAAIRRMAEAHSVQVSDG